MNNITPEEAQKKLNLHNDPEEEFNLTPKTKARMENIAQGTDVIPERHETSEEDLNEVRTGNLFGDMEGGKKRKSRKMRKSRKAKKSRKMRKSRKSRKSKKAKKSKSRKARR